MRHGLALFALLVCLACDVKVESSTPNLDREERQELIDQAKDLLDSLDGDASDPALTGDDTPPPTETVASNQGLGDEEPAEVGTFHFLMERNTVNWSCLQRDGGKKEYIREGVALEGGATLEWRYVFGMSGTNVLMDRKTVDEDDFSGEWQKQVPVKFFTTKRIEIQHTFAKGKGEYTNSTDTLTLRGTTADAGKTFKGHYQVTNDIFSGTFKECTFSADFILSAD